MLKNKIEKYYNCMSKKQFYIINTLKYYTNVRISDSIFLTPMTHLEVAHLINPLNSWKYVGPNRIPVRLFRLIGPPIPFPVVSLVNQSLYSGIFLASLKLQK